MVLFLTVLPLEDKSGPSSRIRIHELAATDSQSLSLLGQSKEMKKKTSARLAQWDKRRSTKREVASSNSSRTINQGLTKKDKGDHACLNLRLYPRSDDRFIG